ncbi:MAG TPA: LLM class flavin-dependent oxidoreductase [Mycobacteriales bacterium]|nr:LLM class flavin-dependent oxidoreductase [Mycobacteriales bacterium]
MDVSVVVLPDRPYPEIVAAARTAESLGARTVWTYDHLAWRDLADGPWLGMVPLLAALARDTTSVRLGPLVSSPNFRHPVTLAKDAMSLDVISDGRVDLGVGAGGVGWDATVLGGEVLPPAERVARFAEFVDLLDVLLREPAGVTVRGERYSAVEARMLPGCVQRPRIPFTLAASGPKALDVVARHGQGWVTVGPLVDVAPDEWFAAVAQQSAALAVACARHGRDPRAVRRIALISREQAWATTSLAAYDDVVARLAALGFDEIALHWPRPWEGRAVPDDLMAPILEKHRSG